MIGTIEEYEAKAQEICRNDGIGDATFYKYKARFGGMNLWDAKKSRALEDENNRPKRMLADLYRSVFQYEKQNGGDGALRKRLRELANRRRGFGYRRLHILHILLQREGVEVTHKKLFRLYREERLTVGKRGGRKRVLGRRRPVPVPDRANRRRSLDLVVGLCV